MYFLHCVSVLTICFCFCFDFIFSYFSTLRVSTASITVAIWPWYAKTSKYVNGDISKDIAYCMTMCTIIMFNNIYYLYSMNMEQKNENLPDQNESIRF